MAAEQRGERSEAQAADLSFCIFPHLTEYLVVDTRRDPPGNPKVYSFSTEQVFEHRFYQELVEGFTALLQQRDQPFMTLMSLPFNVEQMMRQRGMEAMLRALSMRAPLEQPPQIAIVLFTGPLLNADERQVRGVVDRLFLTDTPDVVLKGTADKLMALLVKEREESRRQQREHLQRRLVEGENEFRTIWQRPPEEGAN